MKRAALLAALMSVAVLGVPAVAQAAAPRHSAIFAGYEVSRPNAHLKHVSATFVVPTITCEQNFGGVGPSVLVYSDVNSRTGTHGTSGGGLGVACENGNAFYQSVFIINGQTARTGLLTFSPGDVVEVSVAVTPARTRVAITDATTNQSKSHVGAGKVGIETWIGDNSVNVDGVGGKLDPFTPTHVTNVLIDNRSLGSTDPHRYIWVRNGRTLVTASALQSGENFTLTFRSSG